MQQLEEKTVHCECGECHTLSQCIVEVDSDAFIKMISYISSSGAQNITVFYGLCSDELLNRIKVDEVFKKKSFSFFILPDCVATVQLAKQLDIRRQDMIVAVGGENIISVAKYYAYCVDCPIMICPVGNFTDFTFSKFARLYDGMTYDFYESQTPCGIFVDTSLNKYNEYQTYYISSKFMAVFDNQIKDLIYKMQDCQRMNDFLSDTLKKYTKNFSEKLANKNITNIWTLIRFGQAMSFYNQTKYFLGGDKAICELLNAVRPSADFLKLETIALKLVINTYACFLKQPTCVGDFNINKSIKSLCTFLKMPASLVMKKLSASKILLPETDLVSMFSGYQPYLHGCFKNLVSQMFKIQTSLALKENVLQLYHYCSKDVERAFALSPCLYNKPTLLHILNSFGFMDKLL